MKISEIRELLDANLLVGQDIAEKEVFSACGSDMMSDVLAYVKDQAVFAYRACQFPGHKNGR